MPRVTTEINCMPDDELIAMVLGANDVELLLLQMHEICMLNIIWMRLEKLGMNKEIILGEKLKDLSSEIRQKVKAEDTDGFF